MRSALPFALALLTGCGTSSAPPSTPETELVLVAEPPSTAGAVFLTGELGGDALELQVWVQADGDVFGVSAHVRYDAVLLGAEEHEPLGGLDEARYLLVESSGSVAVGGARLSPDMGGVPVTTPARIATLRFMPPAEPTAFRTSDVTVRRADGSFVAATGFGAAVVDREVER